MDFQTLHDYNRLVRRGMVKPLTCPTDEYEYTVRVNTDDEPVLQCFMCGATVSIGLNKWQEIQAVVREHYA